MSSRRPPMFVVLEGIDRCGKNLQAEMLAKRFRDLGEATEVFTTPDYELASGALASRLLLRQVELSGSEASPASEALVLECVLEANRYEVANRITRCLDSGKNAVCVRWWPSSLVYGLEDGIDTDRLMFACSSMPAADLSVLLNVGVEFVRARLDARNRYEGDVDKQGRMAESYRMLWAQNRLTSDAHLRKWVVVPGDLAPDRVHAWVWDAVRIYRGELR